MVKTADAFLAKNPQLLDEDLTDARTVRRVTSVAAFLEWWCRFRLRGLERVPEGACLMVANHSAGAANEIPMLLRAWRKHWGDRPARGMLHSIAWSWPFRHFPVLQKMGGLFAHPSVGRHALERGCALLVFPGGDLEACRPFSERYRVTFAGRSGFARLAREAAVPVVPVVLCGAHAMFVMMPGTRRLSRTLGAPGRMRAWPLTGGMLLFLAALPLLFTSLWWLVAIVFVQGFIPFPTRVEGEVLPPMRPDLGEDDATFAARVESEMQRAMDRLAAARSSPWT